MDKVRKQEIIEQTREEFKRLVSWEFLNRGPDWVNSWLRYELEWSDGDHGYLTIPSVHVDDFASNARQSYGCFELFKFFAGTRIEHQIRNPHSIDKVIAGYLKNDFEPPKNPIGRPSNWGRDYILITVIRRLCEQEDLKVVRENNQAREISATEIVHAALPRSGMPVVELDSIQKICRLPSAIKAHEQTYSMHLSAILDDLDPVERV